MEIQNLLDTIGNTTLVFLKHASQTTGANIYIKLESKNPGGSVKDRVAYKMIEQALKEGKISSGGTIIEPTSGNTGIGLAFIAPFFGLKTILVMPESMTTERRALLKAFGATLVLTPAALGMNGAMEKAKQLVNTMTSAFMPNQFENPNCPLAHYETTGPEIFYALEKANKQVDFFVAGVGTGGTISGIGQFLKEKNPSVKIIALEPTSSAVLSGNAPGIHGIQGIGPGFVPKNFYRKYVDEIFLVSTEEAKKAACLLMAEEGISCGVSSGANYFATLHYARQNKGKNIVTLLPDGVEKYLSTDLLNFS